MGQEETDIVAVGVSHPTLFSLGWELRRFVGTLPKGHDLPAIVQQANLAA
jgi:hypothetical protein